MKGDYGGMGMLKSISLENYKCFKDKTDIEIAPLTVLCGVNSSGKSSILKSLLMLKQTADDNSMSGSIALSGSLVDCGTFKDVVCDSDETTNDVFTLRQKFEIHNHLLNKTGKFIKKQDAKDFNELRRIYSSTPGNITKFVFETEIVIVPNGDDVNEFSKYISNNIIKSYIIKISAYDQEKQIDQCTGKISFSLNNSKKADDEKPHCLSWENIPGFAKSAKDFNKFLCVCSFNGLNLSNVFSYRMKNSVKSTLPNLLAIFRIVASQYNGIFHIAPLRNMPQRTYFLQGNVNSVGASGENTYALLAKLKNVKVTTDVWCPYTNEKEVDEYGYVKASYYEIIQQWLDYFEMGELEVDGGDNQSVSVKLGKHNIADIGFGMSQFLPIITQGIFMNKDQTLLIEQPEIHLHPKMELQMADFLIQLAERGRNIVVETHSEYIKDRIVHRVFEDDSRELYKLINICFIEKDKKDGYSKITPINLNDEEGILNHPTDFFDQGANEQLAIMKAGVAKRRKIRDKIL